MKYRKLGRTDIDISLLCLGTMTWGQQNTIHEAHQQLDYATERGINFIDTAEMYPVPPRAETTHRTEEYIGSWLAEQSREDLVIATKVVGRSQMDWFRPNGKFPTATKEQIRYAVEGSLRRLHTDYIDLYQIHWPDRPTNFFGKLAYRHQEDAGAAPIEDSLRALAELVEEGKIRHIGLSNETPWGIMKFLQLAEKHDLPRVVSVQNPYSLLNRSFEVGCSEVAIREQVGLLAYSPLGFGMLTGKYDGDTWPDNARLSMFENYDRYTGSKSRAAAEAYNKLAREASLTPAQMALAWVNSRDFLTANIIGATTMKQLEENIDSVHVSLEDDLVEKIEDIHVQFTYPAP